MKTIAISSFFVLFALAVGVSSPAFADHSEVTIEPAKGSGVSHTLQELQMAD